MTPSSSPSSSATAQQDGQGPSGEQLTSSGKQANLMLRVDILQQMEFKRYWLIFLRHREAQQP